MQDNFEDYYEELLGSDEDYYEELLGSDKDEFEEEGE